MTSLPDPAPATPWTLDALVDAFVVARRGGPRPTAARVASALRSAADAYRVQRRVDAVLWPDAAATAWKVGADRRDALPVAAPLAPSLVFADGATLPTASFPVRIVEAEFAYRFGRDLPPRHTPYTSDEVADAIESLHAAIEVVSPRIVDHATASPLAKLADHQVNGAFVLGSGVTGWRRIDPRRQKATLAFDGKVHEAVEGSHALGNPAVLLPWFVAHLGRLPTQGGDGADGPPRGVKAGDVVTTGSWTKAVEAKAGQRVEVDFPGIGRAALAFG